MAYFKWMLQSGNIINNNGTLQDVAVAQQISGANLSVAALKGKTTCSMPPPVVSDFVKVPQSILDAHREVSLSMDVFFVNKIPFLLSISRHLAITTVTHLPNQQMKTVFECFLMIYKLYRDRVSLLQWSMWMGHLLHYKT